MADTVGSLAMTASVVLNISPIADVYDIYRTGTVTERSILPYCMMMVDGANWVLFAFLIDDVFPIGVTNTFGCLCGTAYACVYLRSVWGDKRDGVVRQAWVIFLGALCIISCMIIAGVTISLEWSRSTATDYLGYVVDLFNIMLYGSPLALAWKVLRTRSTSGMYLPLSLTIVAASSLWSAYGFLTTDLFVVVPQSVGLLAGVAQLALFVTFGVADNNTPSVIESGTPPTDDQAQGGAHGGSGPKGNGHELTGRGGDGKPSRSPGAGLIGGSGNDTKDQMRQPLIPE